MEAVTGSESALDRLYRARSVAVIGASSRPGALSWWPLHLLRTYRFGGSIYPVNPMRDEIDGIECFADISSVPGPVDVAVVALNAERTPDAVRACADAGVGVVVLPTQGIGELGPHGKALEAEMVAYARDRGMRIAGPNTDGVANPATGMMATIQPIFGEGIEPGPVAVITQSGATAASIVRRLKDVGLGCRYYASTGNEADLGLEDHLSYVLQDPDVRIVLSFVESIRRPGDFVEVARLARRLGKPIALIKVGRSVGGARRAAAHTGALAGTDRIYDAVFRSTGVIRVGELSELVAVARLHAAGVSVGPTGAGIISVSGGQAGALADAASRLDVAVPPIDAGTSLEFGSAFNPCDLTGAIATTPTLAADVYKGFAASGELGLVVYARKQLTGTAGVDAAKLLVEAISDVPAVVYAMDGVVEGDEGAVYREAGVPVFASAGDLFTAFGALTAGQTVDSVEPWDPVVLDLDGPFDEVRSKAVVAAYGVPINREKVVSSESQAVEAAEGFGFPVVLKAVSEAIPHKSDAGCVAVGVTDADGVRRAFTEIRAAAAAILDGDEVAVLVAEQVAADVEVLMGVTVDPGFGPFVLVGAGGVLTEILDDVAIAPAPVSAERAVAMIESLRLSALLRGVRGRPPLALDALAEAVAALSRFAADHADRIEAVDVNPVMVGVDRVTAVDVLVVPADKP